MKHIIFTVEEEIELLSFLTAKMGTVSKSKVKEILAHYVFVNSRHVSQFNYLLKPGMEVKIYKPSPKDKFKPKGLEIVFEDAYLLVVNKHAGLLSNSKYPNDDTVITQLNSYLRATNQKCNAHIVHRLDRDTSGLMVVSKTKKVSQMFEENWKERVFDRAYVAVAWGALKPEKGTIKTWLTDGEFCVLSSPVDNGGKEAITHYEVKQTNKRYSLVELKLDTGRRNQIRVHLREMKHPVVHDPMYGYKDDESPINRLALHAFRLCFEHPVTKKKMRFETEYPSSFMKLMS